MKNQRIYAREDYILFDLYFRKYVGIKRLVNDPDKARTFHGAWLKDNGYVNGKSVNEYRIIKINYHI
jgi:hypothetical protein